MTIKVKTQISKIRKTALLASAAIALPCSALAQQPAPPAATPASPAAGATTPQKADRSAAYYHFGLAHMYEDMATNYGRPEYATRAIEEYKLALDADPGSKYLNSGLAELYLRTGRVRDAVLAAQEILKTEPNNLEAHKLLGRVYLQSLGYLGCLFVLLGIAVGIYLALVPTLCVISAHGYHQLVGLHRLVCLILLAVNIRQPVEEDGAVILLRVGVLTIRMVGLLHQLLQRLGCIVVVP